jgi:hypothetical protein
MNYCSKDGYNPDVPLRLTGADVAAAAQLFGAPQGDPDPETRPESRPEPRPEQPRPSGRLQVPTSIPN